MDKVQLATRINPKIKKAMQEVCEANGLIMSRFIEDAIKVRLEDFEDFQDAKITKSRKNEKRISWNETKEDV